MKSYTDLMVDLETLGTEPGCVILEIGLCAFNRHNSGRAWQAISIFPSIEEQTSLGMKIDYNTMNWWLEHPEAHEVQKSAARVPMADAQAQLVNFWTGFCNKESYIWAKGTPFDISILRTIIMEPWGFRQIHDLRTLKLIYPDWPGSEMRLIDHVGRYDAMKQAEEVQWICSMLGREI